jgi:hypothetical protein
MKRGQYGGAPTGRSMESAIPIILIIILAVFIAGKIGILDLHGIPVVGALFPAPSIKVAVVGHASPYLKEYLTTETYRVAGVQYVGDIPQEVIYPGVLNNVDIIILENERYCDRTARKVIADAVKAGKKLIVVSDACIRVHDDDTVYGWDLGIGSLGDVMPVKPRGVIAHERVPVEPALGGRFKIVSPEHPIFNGVTNFDFTGPFFQVVPTSNSEVLAFVTAYGGRPTAPSTFAIVESKGMLMGKTLYFTFDPGTGPREMFLNALLYLRGAKG